MAKQALSSIGTKNIIRSKRRIIQIPKIGGYLPPIPIFAALGGFGSIGCGTSETAKAVNDAKAMKEKLEKKEKQHSNGTGTVGKGLYLRPSKKGMEFTIKTPNKVTSSFIN